ncbi:hypothetical protein NM688_g2747 [Phlebia brevispora]|uniref:Uncharacterized protein n=1 Tax=Phlebia brevispora TaxID=194682 RepID=A0ACC1T8E4_9APHY|nr:hypothetical protein NM688_g2747 [Phlebia brevispora]
MSSGVITHQPSEEATRGDIITFPGPHPWNSLDDSVICKISTLYINSFPLPESWQRLEYVSPNNERCKTHKVLRKGFRLHDLMRVCTRWYRSLRTHPYWATFSKRIRCDTCNASCQGSDPWRVSYRILRDHCEGCLYNLKPSHMLPEGHVHSPSCTECLMFVIPEESFGLAPRVINHGFCFDREQQKCWPTDAQKNEFAVNPLTVRSDGSIIVPLCQPCRAEALDRIAKLSGLESLEKCREYHSFLEMVVDTYLSPGCITENLFYEQFLNEEYETASQSTQLCQELDTNTYDFDARSRALVTASPKLERHIVLHFQARVRYAQHLLWDRIMKGYWVNIIEPARPTVLRAEHPVNNAPLPNRNAQSVRVVTWVADARSRKWLPNTGLIEVAPPSLDIELIPVPVQTLFKDTYNDLLFRLLLGPLGNIAVHISKAKKKPGKSTTSSRIPDLKLVFKHLKNEKFWVDTKTKEWVNYILPLIPSRLENLPESTVAVIDAAWRHAYETAVNRTVDGSQLADRKEVYEQISFLRPQTASRVRRHDEESEMEEPPRKIRKIPRDEHVLTREPQTSTMHAVDQFKAQLPAAYVNSNSGLPAGKRETVFRFRLWSPTKTGHKRKGKVRDILSCFVLFVQDIGKMRFLKELLVRPKIERLRHRRVQTPREVPLSDCDTLGPCPDVYLVSGHKTAHFRGHSRAKMTDLTFCYLHMTPEDLEVLDTIGTMDYISGDLSDTDIDVPAFMKPPNPDDSDVLPSEVHPSYPFGNPNSLKHPASRPRRPWDPSSRALFEDMGYAGGGVNGSLRWRDLALDILLPVDEEKEEAERAAHARKMASGIATSHPHPPHAMPQPQAVPPAQTTVEEMDEDDAENDENEEDEDEDNDDEDEDSDNEDEDEDDNAEDD